MAKEGFKMTIKATGPLFGNNVNKIIDNQGNRAVFQLVQMGEQRLDQMLRPRPAGVYLSVQQAQRGQASTGHYRRNLHGTVDGLNGRIDDGNVIYGPWLEGVSSRNKTTRFKGYHSFRLTAQWLRKRSTKVMEFHVTKMVRSLGG